MTSDQRRFCGARLLRPVVLAAGMGLAAAGCCIIPDAVPGPLSSVRLPPLNPGSKAKAEAFRKEVDADPFPSGSFAEK